LLSLVLITEPAIRNPIAISLGAIAALSRYYLTLWFVQRFGTGFPYGTFSSILAVFMGFFMTLALERIIPVTQKCGYW